MKKVPVAKRHFRWVFLVILRSIYVEVHLQRRLAAAAKTCRCRSTSKEGRRSLTTRTVVTQSENAGCGVPLLAKTLANVGVSQKHCLPETFHE